MARSFEVQFLRHPHMVSSSNGQDVSPSRIRCGFDSRRDYNIGSITPAACEQPLVNILCVWLQGKYGSNPIAPT